METRKLPAVTPRVETGPVQFGSGWTGVFIRGDDALYCAQKIRLILDGSDDPIARTVAYGLVKHLESVDEKIRT